MEQAVQQEFGNLDSKQDVGRRSRSMLTQERHGRRLAAAARQPWVIGEAAQQVSGFDDAVAVLDHEVGLLIVTKNLTVFR